MNPESYVESRIRSTIADAQMFAIRAEVVRLLLEAGADVNATGDDVLRGRATALSLAVRRPDVAKLLIDAGAVMNARDSSGETPLMSAASDGSSESVQLLLKAGAEVNAKDPSGKTPLSFAEESLRGARARLQGYHGTSDDYARDVSRVEAQERVVELLKAAGRKK